MIIFEKLLRRHMRQSIHLDFVEVEIKSTPNCPPYSPNHYNEGLNSIHLPLNKPEWCRKKAKLKKNFEVKDLKILYLTRKRNGLSDIGYFLRGVCQAMARTTSQVTLDCFNLSHKSFVRICVSARKNVVLKFQWCQITIGNLERLYRDHEIFKEGQSMITLSKLNLEKCQILREIFSESGRIISSQDIHVFVDELCKTVLAQSLIEIAVKPPSHLSDNHRMAPRKEYMIGSIKVLAY
ncbi:unnamed protein product [Moneuplotes crassus]|uniref:Uncharacterized protein n=1 Tax=Euplotes crassus TaxID=5936 RepID=A0AAD1XU93_EUPCR|nr:unnamed protein product [Moneuplotes crassus]